VVANKKVAEYVSDIIGEKKAKGEQIGCGNGVLARQLAKRGFEVVGVDISREAIRLAKSVESTVIFRCSSFEELRVGGGMFDAIVCFHVLEHMEDPEETLRRVRGLLVKDGQLLIRVPNSDSTEARLAGKAWFHWDEPYHRYHWGAEEVKKMVKEAGFDRVEVRYFLFEFKQVLLYSVLNFLGLRKISGWLKVALLPLQMIFVPLSLVAGFLKNSGTVEIAGYLRP